MNYGLIGLGRWGEKYVKNLQLIKGAKLAYVCSRKPPTLRTALPDECLYTNDYKVLCRDKGIDAVIIATPPQAHFEMCTEALANYKHVICEKPFVFSVDQAKEIQDVSAALGINFLVAYQHLWQPFYLSIDKNIVNKPIRIFSEGLGDGPERDYSLLWDWASHDLSLIFGLLNNIDYVAKIKTSYRKEKKGFYSIDINFKNDSWASILCGNYKFKKSRLFEIHDAINCAPLVQFNDDFQTNPVKTMLESFTYQCQTGTWVSNLCLATKVTEALYSLEKHYYDD